MTGPSKDPMAQPTGTTSFAPPRGGQGAGVQGADTAFVRETARVHGGFLYRRILLDVSSKI